MPPRLLLVSFPSVGGGTHTSVAPPLGTVLALKARGGKGDMAVSKARPGSLQSEKHNSSRVDSPEEATGYLQMH